MKPIQTVAVCTIVFLVVSLGIGTVCAQTKVFTHENGVLAQAFAGDRAVFFGDTTLTMETEPEGGWLPNKTYQVNWTLSLESVTPGFLNDTAFYILVSWPPLENITLAIPAETILNQTQLNLEHKMGTISAAFTPTNASDGFYMNPDFPFTVYINNEPSTEVWASGMWHGGGGISTNIIGNDTTPHSPLLTSTATEFPTLTVAIAAATLLVALPLVIVKKRSSRR